MVEFGKEYSYKDVCAAHGWKETSGQAKQRQIECLKKSYEFYHPKNPKTGKEKKTYIFTKMLKEPILTDGRVNNGGFRESAGKKALFEEEKFNYLWMKFVTEGYIKNKYHEREWLDEIYFSNSLLFREFGFDFYWYITQCINYSDTDKLARKVFEEILYGCVKAQTIARLCKRYGFKKNSLPKGILRSRSKNYKNQFLSDNDLLPKYTQYLAEELEKWGYKNEKAAIDAGKYLDIIEEVQSRFETDDNKLNVQRLNCIKVTDLDVIELGKNTHQIDNRKIEEYRKNFKNIILESVEKSITKRIKNDKKYKLRLSNVQKGLLMYYLQQLKKGKRKSVVSSAELGALENEPEWLKQIV